MKLGRKIMLTTGGFVAPLMIGFGLLMGQQLGKEVREQADSQASDKAEQIVKALEVVDDLSSRHVTSTLRVFVREGRRLGEPEIRGTASLDGHVVPDLCLGKSSQVGNFELVDSLKEATGDVATLFVKQNLDFVRVSTSITKPDGTRAVGTLLDPHGKAYEAISAGRGFSGVADILGSPYMAGYEPIRDRSGQVIGIWFVGTPLSALTRLGNQISAAKVLENGYVALLKPDGSVLFKPERVGAEDVQRRAKQGERGWTVTSYPFDQWGYTLQAAYPESDVAARRRPVQLMAAGCTVLLMLLLATAEDILMLRMVVKPLRKLTEQKAEAIAAGDLTTEDLQVTTEDELGDLARAINKMNAELREVIEAIARDAHNVATASEEFSVVSQHISANSEETSAQANAVTTATEQVNRGLQTVATATEEMSASIKEIAKNATEAAKVADEGLRTANETNAIVAKLGESSAEIGQVIKVITSIAQKTDLLALNATVEAARAGEVGAGFAVVANEVKELAKQTAGATEDISRKIAAIRMDAKSAVEAIQSISGVIGRMDDIATTIATAVEEQSATTAEMSRNVSEAARGSSEVAQNIQGVARAAQSTSQEATDSQQAVQNLAQMSTQLRELVGRFKLQSNGEGAFADREKRLTSARRSAGELQSEVVAR